jgi:hypothetical protein
MVKKKVESISQQIGKKVESKELDIKTILKLSKEADELLLQFVEGNKIINKD